MLIVVAGEDAAASREKLRELTKSYEDAQYQVTHIPLNSIEEVWKNSSGVVDLFGRKAAYTVDDLSSKYKGREKTLFKETVKQLASDDSIVLIDWENGKSAYDLSSLKRIASSFQESKPKKSIFQVLDLCIPTRLPEFLSALKLVSLTQDSVFIYVLLWKHVRKLVQAKHNIFESSLAPWQKNSLVAQSNKWDKDSLESYYENLTKIDISIKTGTTPYTWLQSIELVSCYYLR